MTQLKARNTLRGLAASVLALGSVAAAHAADVYVIHGINGNDLGAPEALEVDISINGACTLTDVPFRTIAGPLDIPAGTYDIEVRLAGGGDSCTGPLAVTKSVDLQLTESTSLVAHLSEQGTPDLSKFVNDVRPLDWPRKSRLTIRHTAAAAPVTIRWEQNGTHAFFPEIANANQRSAELSPGEKNLVIKPFREGRIGPIPVVLEQANNVIVYAIGSLKNGTFEPLVQQLPNLDSLN